MKTYCLHDTATVLFAVFMALTGFKVLGYLDWSWWAVCAPLAVPFIPVAVVCAYVLIVGMCTVLVAFVVTVLGLLFGGFRK